MEVRLSGLWAPGMVRALITTVYRNQMNCLVVAHPFIPVVFQMMS